MKVLELGRYVLGVSIAVSLLAGCSGSQPPTVAPGAVPQGRAVATHAERGESWMLPEAVTQDLLYVAGGNGDDVPVYSYPKGRLLGTLTGFNLPSGACVDKTGDVFIADYVNQRIVEYKHGAKNPKQILAEPGEWPTGCAIDPTTGNLAVTNHQSPIYGTGDVVVYAHAQGSPKSYTDPNIYYYYWCGYDSKGNLYIDGQAYNPSPFRFAELPKGANQFKSIVLNQKINFPGGVQWDGQFVAVGDQATSNIYRFSISGSDGTLKGTVLLNNASSVQQFWIQGGVVIAGNAAGSHYNELHFYHYPAGGNPTKTITKGIAAPSGATVSLAPGAKSHSMHNAKERS
jgi:sugar lactone lactonase YvrE